LAGAICLTLGGPQPQKPWRVLTAALLLGCAVACRPPNILLAPAFLWLCRGYFRSNRRATQTLRLGLAAVSFLLPLVVHVAYVYWRDRPTTPFSYIAQYHDRAGHAPPDRPAARWARTVDHCMARQYRTHLGVSYSAIRQRGPQFTNIALPVPTWARAVVVLGALAGLVILARSRPDAALLLGTVVALGVIYGLLYNVWGQAADVLPLVWAGAALLGVSLQYAYARLAALADTRPNIAPLLNAILFIGAACLLLHTDWATGAGVLPLIVIATLLSIAVMAHFWAPPPDRIRHFARATAVLLAGVLVWGACQTHIRFALGVSADRWLASKNIKQLPPNAAILTGWTHRAPLEYARLVDPGRADLLIVNAPQPEWSAQLNTLAAAGRPILAVQRFTPPAGWQVQQHGPWWRVAPAAEVSDAGPRRGVQPGNTPRNP
jgi:hypothetical protein